MDDVVEDGSWDEAVEDANDVGEDDVDVDEGIAVEVEDEGITVVETTTVDVEAGGVRPPYTHSEPRGIWAQCGLFGEEETGRRLTLGP